MKAVALVLLLCWVAPFLSAETRFWLRNTDETQLFCWWSVPYAASAGAALGSLATSRSGRHPVAPGERIEVSLGEGEELLGVFVPWRSSPTLTTRLTGGWILAREAPERGTVLVDEASFAITNRGRSFLATLQEWGQEPPRMVLDGSSADWNGTSAALEWGPRFRASEAALPSSVPRPLALSVRQREGALWVNLSWEPKAIPAGTALSLLLEAGPLRLEWPVAAGVGPVWLWTDDGAQAVGQAIVHGASLEAWVPLDRISSPLWRVANNEPGRLVWACTTSDRARTVELGNVALEDLP